MIIAGREAQELFDDVTRAKCLELIHEEQEEIHAYKKQGKTSAWKATADLLRFQTIHPNSSLNPATNACSHLAVPRA